MKRELNELKSRTINRAAFIGTVINMPQASQGVGSGIFSIPWSSHFTTKKGKEILIPQQEKKRDIKTQAPFTHFPCLYPSPYDKAVPHASRNIEKEDLDRGNLERLWRSHGARSQLLKCWSRREGMESMGARLDFQGRLCGQCVQATPGLCHHPVPCLLSGLHLLWVWEMLLAKEGMGKGSIPRSKA